ncbi:MAG: hypothetical protein JW715_08075 [Sedimentisphaerales bacterium]|nr:hypothetical protein [Sedimentisphaerales bacterium]
MRYKYIYRIIWFCLIVTICLFGASARSQQNTDKQQSDSRGRIDPFGQLVGLGAPVPETVVAVPVETAAGIPELFVRTVMLKFLDAKSLEKVIGKMSSEYGSISTNEKNNSIIICDTRATLDKILREIENADKTPRQIMIEVVILDVKLDDDTEIGVNWDILSDNRYDISYRQNFTASRLGSTVEDETTIGDASAFNTTGLGGSFSVISGTIRNVVHLIQQKRDVEILASPRVMLVSGESASIEAVEELPYTEIMDAAAGGAAALTTTRFKNVGVQLKVEATLTDANDILLKVITEQNVATGQSDTEVPIIDTRKADTSLLLSDGQVVVLGGLRRQEKTKEIDQIPFLGDLPIIGNLFKNTNTVVKNSELIVFLSPHIYRGEPVPEDAMSKYRQITEKPVLRLPDDIISKEREARLRREKAEREQYERNVAKMILLDKIKILRQRKDKEATRELLSALAELDEIISQELNETIASSEKVIAGGDNTVDKRP